LRRNAKIRVTLHRGIDRFNKERVLNAVAHGDNKLEGAEKVLVRSI
jgi:hypothetical protein